MRRPGRPLGSGVLPTHKHVWFQLDLPERPVGTRHAGPALPADLLPVADERVRVAVVQIDRSGAITAWNGDAEHLFGYPADQTVGKQLGDFAAWPHTPGTGTGLAEPCNCPAGRAATASAAHTAA